MPLYLLSNCIGISLKHFIDFVGHEDILAHPQQDSARFSKPAQYWLTSDRQSRRQIRPTKERFCNEIWMPVKQSWHLLLTSHIWFRIQRHFSVLLWLLCWFWCPTTIMSIKFPIVTSSIWTNQRHIRKWYSNVYEILETFTWYTLHNL